MASELNLFGELQHHCFGLFFGSSLFSVEWNWSGRRQGGSDELWGVFLRGISEGLDPAASEGRKLWI